MALTPFERNKIHHERHVGKKQATNVYSIYQETCCLLDLQVTVAQVSFWYIDVLFSNMREWGVGHVLRWCHNM